MKKISILIPVYNNIEYTKKCIQTLDKLLSNTKFKNGDFHVVVIDDGSSDGTFEWLDQNHPEISVLKGNGNLWWSGGINLGVNYSMSELKADFLLLWNNDIIPAPDYFINLDNLLNSIDNQTIAGSKVFLHSKEQNNIIFSFGAVFNPRNGVKYLIGFDMPDSDAFAHPREVDWLPGMGTLISSDVIRNIGLWDEKVFPQYHGDSDFTFRAKTAGYKVIAFPQLTIWNDKTVSGLRHGGTIKGFILTLKDRRSNASIRENYLFYKRHSTSILAYHVLIVLYVRYFGSFIKWKALSLFGKHK